MKAGGGPLKGANMERDVCKDLSLWISKGERDDIFWRTALSGGRSTIGLTKGLSRSSQAGDVGLIDELGSLLLNSVIIEIKFYKDLELFKGITKDNGILYGFWQEHQQKGRQYNKYPMLIARQNNMPTCILLPKYALAFFGMSNDSYIVASFPRWGCVMILFDAFLREAKPPESDARIEMISQKRVILT